jgi:hypothetical protein
MSRSNAALLLLEESPVLRLLRRDFPAEHARVISGELTPAPAQPDALVVLELPPRRVLCDCGCGQWRPAGRT